ncbi:MAG: nucleotide-binding protein [Paenibacillaceae bacterium]|nr:nucleotide-binding protein [Paenibacillaceae bacterium]
MTKPNVFIGSSREAMNLANAIHSQISYYAQVTPWYSGVFEDNNYTMESLERQLDKSDFGIFVFAPDDIALYRDKFVFITRDNTLFEMGLFWGRLRRQRVFAIVPQEVKERDDLIKNEKVRDFHLLTDLQRVIRKASKALVATRKGGVGVVYIGPSVEGGDKEYVKVLTGDVDSRKPSFV